MVPFARDSYLSTVVKTAAPQKLQWLLVEAALRSANRAGEFWRQGDNEQATEAIVHAQTVLGQMLAAIDRDGGGELAKQVSTVYEFIFRSLVKAGHRRDEQSLAEAIRVLEIERETWRQLCAKIAAERIPASPAAPYARFGAPVDDDATDFAGGFSFEA
jgi:flagellar secretion chaperone FliS